MAWPINFSSGDDVLLFSNLITLWGAAQERSWALNSATFPERVNVPWDAGTISGFAADGDNFTLTDGSKAWDVSRWAGYTSVEAPWLPEDYDVIIDYDNLDHSKHVRAQILSNTADELTITSVKSYAEAKWIPSTASLNGKNYIIVKRDGLGWGDFWPKTPNDHQLWNGTRGPGVSVTVVGFTGLTPDGSYVGKTFDDTTGSGLILAQTADTFIVGWMATAPAGSFDIKDGATVIATATVSGTVKDGIYREQGDFATFTGADLVINNYPYTIRIASLAANTGTLITFAKQSAAFDAASFSCARSKTLPASPRIIS